MVEKRDLRINLSDHRPLGDIVYEVLRDAIIKQVLKPGERLMETELAEEMDVSRTPIREAMRKLELEGYVVMVPRKGAYVASLSIEDITSLFEIRGALEALAAGLAAKRASSEEIKEMERNLLTEEELFAANNVFETIEMDAKFHELIYSASRNQRLQNMIKDLRDQIQRFRATSLSIPGRMRLALEEHRKIVEAIMAGDVIKAQEVTAEHLRKAKKVLLKVIAAEEEAE